MSKYARFVIFPFLLIAVGCEAAVDFALDDHHPDGDPAAAIATRVADGRLSKERTTEVQAIWHEYRSNEALANSRYRDQYYTVGGLVERVDEDGVEFVMDAYGMGVSSARFARSAQDTLLTISPYDVVILSCRVRGLVLDFMLSFEDCIPVTWPGADAVTWPQADTGVGAATPVPAATRSEPLRGITPLPTVTPSSPIPTNTPRPTERPVWTVITHRTVTGIVVDGYEHPPDTIALIQGEDGDLRCRVDAEDHHWAPVDVGDVLTVRGIPVPVGDDVTPLLDLCRVTAWAPEQ